MSNKNCRAHTVKNQNQSSSNLTSYHTRPIPRTPDTQINPQPLNPQTLHQHTITEAHLSQNPYHEHIKQQNESRSLHDSFYSLEVEIPSDFYRDKISGIYQSHPYTSIPTQDFTPTQAYSTQYLAPETTTSYTIQPTDDGYTWAKPRDEYETNEEDVMDSSNELHGVGGQFPVYSYQTPRYSDSISQLEADMMDKS